MDLSLTALDKSTRFVGFNGTRHGALDRASADAPVCLELQADNVASVSGFSQLQQEVGKGAGQAAGLRQGLEAQRAAFASLQDAAKVSVMPSHVRSHGIDFQGCLACHVMSCHASHHSARPHQRLCICKVTWSSSGDCSD